MVRQVEKRLRRLQRQVSRKYEMNKEGNRFVKTSNIIKIEKEIRQLHRRLSNIRKNHLHQSTSEIENQAISHCDGDVAYERSDEE